MTWPPSIGLTRTSRLGSQTEAAGGRAWETASNIAKASSDATIGLPGPAERRAMDEAGSLAERSAEAIASVTPESVKKMEEKVMNKVHEVRGQR